MRTKQKTFLTFRLKLILGASVFAAATIICIVVFNFWDVKDSKAFSSGDYRTVASGNWDEAEAWEVFDGDNWVPASLPPLAGHPSVVVTAGQKLVLTDEITLNQLTIEKDAILEIGSNQVKVYKKGGKGGVFCYGELDLGAVIIEGDGDFVVGPEGTLMIGSDAGINRKIRKGNVQLKGKWDLSKDAFYVYNGTTLQHTGTGLPSIIRNLVIENRSGVMMDQTISVTGYLGLRIGTFFTSDYVLTLGDSHNNPAVIDYVNGALSGKIKCWFGQKNFEKLTFPLSDGNSISNFTFQLDFKDYQKGMLEFIYISGIPDDSKKSPFDARQVVIGITQNGFHSVKLTNGPDEAWLRFVSNKYDDRDQINYIWDIAKRNSKSSNASVLEKTVSFSNMIYGPQPFYDRIIFRFYSEVPSTSYVQIINSSGRMVFNHKTEVVEGYNQSEIQIDSTLPDGNYILQISNSSEIQTMKVVKFKKDPDNLTFSK